MCVDPDISGWRDICLDRVNELVEAFQRGEFGMSALCKQVLEKEGDGKKLLDDGLSTVSALQRCKAMWKMQLTGESP